MARYCVRSKRKKAIVMIVLCVVMWLTFHSQIVETLDKHIYQRQSNINIQGGISYMDNQGAYQLISDKNPKQVLNSQGETKIIPSQGEQLAARLRQKCSNFLHTLPQRPVTFPVTTNSYYKVMLCPMCKLASTYWTRFFKLLEKYNENENVTTPYDIPIVKAPPTKERLKIVKGQKSMEFNDYYKFVFVRDPYARILSAYIDKLFAPNPYFWRSNCKKIINEIRGKEKSASLCGSDLKFKEYIQAINKAHLRPFENGMVDCHDASFMGASHPCEVQYDYVGKMENFAVDSGHLYRKLKLQRSIEALKTQGRQLADDDALNDTVNSPFLWKEEIKKCIPWHEALNRVWKKLQIRGVIGKHPLPLDAQQANEINRQEFLDLIKTTQKLTSYEERKKQRTEALIEIYSQVDQVHLERLKQSYKNDFDFFEYDNSPSIIFNINKTNIKYYGYLDI